MDAPKPATSCAGNTEPRMLGELGSLSDAEHMLLLLAADDVEG